MSLVASGTEIVAALGWEAFQVARSHQCDYPPSALDLPVCTRPRFDVDGSSAEIELRVARSLEQQSPLYRVDAELLAEIQPTLVITQDQCEVCAVSLDDVKAACRSIRSQPDIVTLGACSLEDVWSDIRVVARALGAEDEGRRLAARLERRVEQVSAESRGRARRPRIACVEWIDPLMISGNWVPELVDRAGGEAVLSRAGEQTRHVSWSDLVDAGPDIIVLMPCGFDIPRTRKEMQGLVETPGWKGLSAVVKGQVYLTDGNQYFNRSGPRLVESVEILAEILSQSKQDYGHRGEGWMLAFRPSDD